MCPWCDKLNFFRWFVLVGGFGRPHSRGLPIRGWRSGRSADATNVLFGRAFRCMRDTGSPSPGRAKFSIFRACYFSPYDCKLRKEKPRKFLETVIFTKTSQVLRDCALLARDNDTQNQFALAHCFAEVAECDLESNASPC